MDAVEAHLIRVLRLHQGALEDLIRRGDGLEKRIAFLEEMLLDDRKESK